jgi:Ca2+-binding RTX toxin-like protein
MRRGTMLVAAIAVMVALFATVAYAAKIDGTQGRDLLFESQLDDTINAGAGNDSLKAQEFIRDKDELRGNSGNDLLRADDGDGLDTLNGGAGDEDLCIGDAGDEFLNCEDTVERG